MEIEIDELVTLQVCPSATFLEPLCVVNYGNWHAKKARKNIFQSNSYSNIFKDENSSFCNPFIALGSPGTISGNVLDCNQLIHKIPVSL